MRIVILAAAVAVAFTSFASAKEVKKDTTKAPVVASKTMTDTDMDKVTAGYVFGNGIYTANNNGGNLSHLSLQGSQNGVGKCHQFC